MHSSARLRIGCRCAAALGLAALAVSCGPQRLPPFERIVLVSLDTVRADHMGTYGYPRDTTPFLDSMAALGVLFERAYAQMSTTTPSHASVFTGLYPIQHGVRANGRQLLPQFVTLAERLRERGFTTAGFTATHAHWQPAGLDQGFETLVSPPADAKTPYRPADRMIDRALGWLANCTACERLFLFLHLFDTHIPLQPPARHLEFFTGLPKPLRKAHVTFLRDVHRVPAGFYRNKDRGLLALIDRYDAELRFADTELKRFFETYEDMGLASNTLWIVMGDHGEGLGNHGWQGHGRHLYDVQLRVPLLFYSADGRLPPRRVDTVVELVDLMPTILALTGDERDGVHGDPRTEGRSLIPLLRGGHLEQRPAFAQRRALDTAEKPAWLVKRQARDPDFEPVHDWISRESGEYYAWVEGEWKLLHRTAGPDALFNLVEDPYEIQNLIDKAPAEAARLRGQLEAQLERLQESAAGEAPFVDDAAIEALRALGYTP
jgi:arylsulfatase A-like enzyme